MKDPERRVSADAAFLEGKYAQAFPSFGSERTVTAAVGHGKKAARNIDAYLRGGAYAPPPKHDLATFERLNAWYYDRRR